MNAMLIDAGGRLAKTVVPDPVRREGEVLIEVHAAAVNRADLMQCDGNYPPPPGWPEWPGLEVAGIVLEPPDSSRFRPGDRVCALLGGEGMPKRSPFRRGWFCRLRTGSRWKRRRPSPKCLRPPILIS